MSYKQCIHHLFVFQIDTNYNRIVWLTVDKKFSYYLRRVWRYQRGNQNPYIEEQTTQWPKVNVQRDEQRSTKHTYTTKDRVTRAPLKTGGELRWSGSVSSFCSTSDTRRVNIVTNLVIGHELCHMNAWQESLFL